MEGSSSSSSRPSSSTHDNHLLVDDFDSLALYDSTRNVEEFPIPAEFDETQVEEILETSMMRNLRQKQKESGEQAYCAICMEVKPVEEIFKNQNCSHTFCHDCVGIYLTAKIQENISTVNCPDPKCSAVLDPHQCISIIPKDLFDKWGNILCENMVFGSKKFYCPFNDCSAMLLNDEEEGVVTVSECPHCHRLFCAQCKVAWHSGIDCRQFKNLNEGERGREDLMAMELAKNKGWRRCPSCNFYVEKIDGCSHISCRCGYQFCYGCGTSWSQSHKC